MPDYRLIGNKPHYQGRYDAKGNVAPRKYMPGEIVTFEGGLPRGFADKFEPMDEEAATAMETSPVMAAPPGAPQPQQPRYKMRTKGGGWWDVVDMETGEAMNTKALRAGEAQQVLADLQGAA